jgi:hypothetical protein
MTEQSLLKRTAIQDKKLDCVRTDISNIFTVSSEPFHWRCFTIDKKTGVLLYDNKKCSSIDDRQ